MGLILLLVVLVMIWGLYATGTFDKKNSPSSKDEPDQLQQKQESQGAEKDAQSRDIAKQSGLEQIRRQVREEEQHQKATEEAKRAEEEAQEERARQNALARQKALEDKYFNSPLTRQIIDAISDGTGQLPEEITVHNDHVTGHTNGQTRTFDFAANQVPFLNEAYVFAFKSDEVDLLTKPQMALGNAINRILHERYEVHDKANYKRMEKTDFDGKLYYLHEYTSDHVLLCLKAANQW